jgi:hypothetical protein
MQSIIDPKLLERLRVGPLAQYFDPYLARIEEEGLPTTDEVAIPRVFLELYFFGLGQRYATAREFQLLQGFQGVLQDGDAHLQHALHESWPQRGRMTCGFVTGAAIPAPPVQKGLQPLLTTFVRALSLQAKGFRSRPPVIVTIAECMGCPAALDRIMEQAGLLHIKGELTDESGKLKEPAWMKIPDVEKAAIDRELRTKVAAMTFEEQEARWIELKDAPDSYANLTEALLIMLG